MALKNGTSNGAGANAYYVDGETLNALHEARALVVDVKRVQEAVPTPYGPKDTAYTSLAVFASDEELENGAPTVHDNAVFKQGKYLVEDLKQQVGETIVVRLDQKPAKTAGYKPTWVFRPVDDEVFNKVKSYVEAQEAEIQKNLAEADDVDFI